MKIYRGQAQKLGGLRVWYLIVDGYNVGYHWGSHEIFAHTSAMDTLEIINDHCYQEISWLEFMITHGVSKSKVKTAIREYWAGCSTSMLGKRTIRRYVNDE